MIPWSWILTALGHGLVNYVTTARNRKAFVVLAREALRDEILPSDIFSQELYQILWGDFKIIALECIRNGQAGLVDVVIYIIVVLKHPKARITFINLVIKSGLTAISIHTSVRDVATWYDQLEKCHKFRNPKSLIKVHGPGYVQRAFSSVNAINTFANGTVGLHRLINLDPKTTYTTHYMASLCIEFESAMVSLNKTYNDSIRDTELDGFQLAHNYTAPWASSSAPSILGFVIRIDENTRWMELSLGENLEFGGLGCFKSDQEPFVHQFLSSLRVTSVYDLVTLGNLPKMAPREVSWILCLAKKYITSALAHIDNNSYSDVNVRYTFGKDYDQEPLPFWNGSIPGYHSDTPPWRKWTSITVGLDFCRRLRNRYDVWTGRNIAASRRMATATVPVGYTISWQSSSSSIGVGAFRESRSWNFEFHTPIYLSSHREKSIVL